MSEDAAPLADTEQPSDTPSLSDGATADADQRPGAPASEGVGRRPNAAASAASRARRIGGARSVRTSGASEATKTDAAKTDAAKTDAAKTDAAKTDGAARTDLTKARATPGGTSSAKSLAAESTAPGPQPVVITQVPPWLRWVPAAVLSACAIAMLVLLLIAADGTWYSKPSSSALRDRVLAAAKTCTAAANTYSYTTLGQDERKGLDCSTGRWADQYRQAIKSVVTPTATKLKASQSVQINNAGIQSISDSGNQWTIVVYGQTKVTQAKTKPRLDPFSAIITMDDVGGKWLISNIDTVVKPTG